MKQIKSGDAYNSEVANVNWKLFYKQIWILIIPMAIQNLINVGVTASDVLMLGRVGEKVLSGASLAGQIQFIMTLILMGITSGASVLTAQYWGKRDKRTIEKVMGMGMMLGLILAIAFTFAAQAFPEELMRIFTNDPEVVKEGAKYLKIVSLTYVLIAITTIYLYIMRSIERVVIATIVYSVSLVWNIIVNALLIFGLFGLPKLGIVGAAIGTLTARIVELVIVIWYARVKNHDVKFHFKDMWHIDKVLFKDFMVYAVPVILNEMLWGSGTAANIAVIGHLGSAAVAANSVVQMVRQLSMVVALGVANATAIYLGKTIGEKKYELAKAYGKRLAVLSVVMGVAGAILLFLSIPFAKEIVVLSPEAEGYLGFMFFVMSYFTVCQSFNSTMVVGTFRAGGDTKFGLILDASTMWGGSILFGSIAAFIFHASVPVVYVILMCDEVIKIPITFKRFISYKWIKNVTRDAQDLEQA